MKNIRYILILLLYSCFVLLNAFDRFLYRWLFVRYLFNTNFVRRRAAKFGIGSPYHYFKNRMVNPRSGMNVHYSGNFVMGWVTMVCWGVLNLINVLSDNRLYAFVFESTFWMITGFILFLSLVYFSLERLVYKDDVYLNYFSLFERETKKRRVGHILTGVLILVSGFSFFVVSVLMYIRK